MHMFHDALVSFAERRVICMKELSKTLTGKKIRDEMLKRKMTVRDLQDALELDSPQSISRMHWNWTVPSRSISGFAGNRSPLFRICWSSVSCSRFRWKGFWSMRTEVSLTTVSSMTAFLTRLPIWSRTKMTFPQKGGMWHGQIPSREPVTQESLICLRSVLTQKLLITDI